MESEIVIRGGWDRLRYTLTFEGLLIGLLTPGLAFVFERSLTDIGALALILSLKAMLMTYLYNSVYDRLFPVVQPASQRCCESRAAHAP